MPLPCSLAALGRQCRSLTLRTLPSTRLYRLRRFTNYSARCNLPICIDHSPARRLTCMKYIATTVSILGINRPITTLTPEGRHAPPPRRSRVALSRNLSRNIRRRRRQSRPLLVLDSIRGRARRNYSHRFITEVDLSGASARQRRILRNLETPRMRSLNGHAKEDVTHNNEPLSLYTILARYIGATSMSPLHTSGFSFTDEELDLLGSRGYSAKSVEVWASSLVRLSSITAAESFLPGKENPPLFVVLLFLGRTRLKELALGTVMRHIDRRLQHEELNWSTLKFLVVRLLRHARIAWPESLPWIASLFTTEASKIWDRINTEGGIPPSQLSDFTLFCNFFLQLLSVPVSIHPILSSLHQQNAQFRVLGFMASRSPALIVTRIGFRATARVQLVQPKTAQEQEWAGLKRASWPPWKQDRNALDEGKGYEFGASRALQILHHMYKAGYSKFEWESLVELYAGWDTDFSPTIQTRITLPSPSFNIRNAKRFGARLWAGRVKATRTRREAWACFLACEASDILPGQEVYHAMFEKLYYPEHHRRNVSEAHSGTRSELFPGDVKEVWPEPHSPIDLTYVAEPVPSYEQLYHRMTRGGIQPKSRLLAFLIETAPNFSLAMKIMESAQDDFGGGLKRLLNASIFHEPTASLLPDYVLAAFIRFLCHFGGFACLPRTEPITPSLEYHADRFKSDQHYLLEYAYSLLALLRPNYRPAWTVYMQKLKRTPFENSTTAPIVRYQIVSQLLNWMRAGDIDLDEEQFYLVCIFVGYAALSAPQCSTEDARHVLTEGPRQLRTLFHDLVRANPNQYSSATPSADGPGPIPPHIPGPATLHAYVRALGMLSDFEGLYSFSTWATNNHIDILARVDAQHGGQRLLRNTLIAMRAALDGFFKDRASSELVELIKAQVESVDEWGGWPTDHEVDLYIYARRIYTV